MTEKLEIAVTPLGGDTVGIDFVDFQREMAAVSRVLFAIDEDVNLGRKLDWKVTDLHHSRATVQITSHLLFPEMLDADQRVLQTLFDGLKRLARGSDPEQFGADAIDGIKEALAPIGKSLREVVLIWNQAEYRVDLHLKDAVSRIKFRNERYREDWDGVVDEINVHGKPTFRLYPAAGPRWITCEFGDDKLEEAKQLLTRKVQATGEAEYRPGARFPHRLYVDEFVALDEPETAEPAISRGAVASDEIPRLLRELRDEWGS